MLRLAIIHDKPPSLTPQDVSAGLSPIVETSPPDVSADIMLDDTLTYWDNGTVWITDEDWIA